MLTRNDWKIVLRPLWVPLAGEGLAMGLCVWPALHFGDGTAWRMALAAALTLGAAWGLRALLRSHLPHGEAVGDKRMSYVTVTLMWVVMTLFGMLPFLLTGSCRTVTDAFFESMSGLTSTGATIFPDVEALPQSVLLWRSVSEWMGGFGIILLVLAVVPRLGLNKYSLYTAEASGADNTGKTTTTMRSTVQHTLAVYVLLTLAFVVLLRLSGMTLWEAVNLTFTNISTGGFSIYSDSIARFSPAQQYLLAGAMLAGGVNFALLYNFFTFRWSKIKHKLDQFGFYIGLAVLATAFAVGALYLHHNMALDDAVRIGVVQTVSQLTTTGSVVADTTSWWAPVVLLFLVLPFCGGMAGSTTGGVKVMRLLILFRNVRNVLKNRLHPHAYNPVRLNGKPVTDEMITNVMVIFIVFVVTLLTGLLLLMLTGVAATESIGAVIGCVTTFGPGLGPSGGFGSYVAFPLCAKWICSFLMLLGRLECLTVLILLLPGFWRRR